MTEQELNAGPGATAIQVAGNNVTISVGATGLVLERRHKLNARRAVTDLQLLLTELREIDLVGRESELAALNEWMATNAEISVRCMTGKAGAGKTRLAIELCQCAEMGGWHAGFVRHEGLKQDLSGWHWADRTLIVVDYAAASVPDLRRWLDALASRAPGANKLRLLLLERYAMPGVGWWQALFGDSGMTGLGPADLLDPPAPVPLGSVRDVAHRRKLLAQVMAKAAALNKVSPVPQPPELGADPAFDRLLAEDRLDHEPLFLAMAGVVAVGTNAPAALALGRLDLANRVAQGEERRLRRLAEAHHVDPDLLTHLAACVTLQNGCDREAAEMMAEEERAATDPRAAGSAEFLVSILRDAFPLEGGVDAIRPDLVGEVFLMRVFVRGERPIAKQATIVERAFARAGLSVIRTLIRTAQDHCGGRADHASLLWLDQLIAPIDDPFRLMEIAGELPQQSVGLRERAASLQNRISKLLRDLAAHRPDAFRPALAGSLNSLANWLSELGDREAALAAAREAADLYHALAAQRPDTFRSDLAGSLNNLGNRLAELGNREAALEAARNAADLYRVLAAQRRGSFRPNLAGSLNNLGNRLSKVGDRGAALEAAREAVDIWRALVAERPDVFRPDLAMSLNNLANRLSEVGDGKAALEAAREAVDIGRVLAAQRPDAFRPDLAGSLNNLGIRLSEVGDREAALEAAHEAADLYRTLAAQRPDAFHPKLATSLNNLANRLSEGHDREAALAAAREAVVIWRSLATQRPDAFRPDLAVSLRLFADCVEDEDLAGALAATTEAFHVHANLFAARPRVFASQMAKTADDYVRRCERAGHEPDTELLTQIAALFEKLQASPETAQK